MKIAAVAIELCIALSALHADFARFRGYSPGQALQRVLALLRSTDLSLQEIAGASGFYSASHLSRHVKDATALWPSQWRRANETPDFAAALRWPNRAPISVAPACTKIRCLRFSGYGYSGFIN